VLLGKELNMLCLVLNRAGGRSGPLMGIEIPVPWGRDGHTGDGGLYRGMPPRDDCPQEQTLWMRVQCAQFGGTGMR
jgi:hypothetical protein